MGDEEKIDNRPLGMQFKEEGLSNNEPSEDNQPTHSTTDSSPKANNYKQLEDYLTKKVAEGPDDETDEERKKREKHEKRVRFLAGLADGLGSFHRAFAFARGEKTMELPNLSEKAQARFDKAKADREHDQDRWMNYALNLGRLQDNQQQMDYRNRTLALRERQEERLASNADLATRKQDWKEKYDAGILDLKKEQLEIDRDFKEGRITQMQRDAASRELQAQAALLRAQNYSRGRMDEYVTRETYEYDPLTGKRTGSEKRREVVRHSGGQETPSGENGNNDVGNAGGGTMPGVEDDAGKMPGVE